MPPHPTALARVLLVVALLAGCLVNDPARAQPTVAPNWSVDLGLESHPEDSGVAVSQSGLVLVAGRHAVDRAQYSVRALSPGDGVTQWDYVATIGDTRVNGSMVVIDDQNDRVYTMIGDSIAALQASTGLQFWRSEPIPGLRYLSLAGDGSVLTTYPASGFNKPGLLALDRVTGQERWRRPADGAITTPAATAPSGHLCYGSDFGSDRREIVSIDPGIPFSGAAYFNTAPLPGFPAGTLSLIALSDSSWFAGMSNYVRVRLSLGESSTLSRLPTTVAGTSEAIEGPGGTVYLGIRPFGAFSTPVFAAFNANNGTQVWGSGVTNPTTAALSAQGLLYVGANSRIAVPGPGATQVGPVLYAVDASTGSVRWRAGVNAAQLHAPIISHAGHVYVRTTAGTGGDLLLQFPGTNGPAPGVWAMQRGDPAGTGRHPLAQAPATNITVVAHPTDVTVGAGANVLFQVSATGPAPLFYQWRKEGVPIPGASPTPLLMLSNVTARDAGNYSVVITNLIGHAATSRLARLTVTNAVDPNPTGPTILVQPQDLTLTVGESGHLVVGAAGSGPLSYLWYHNGRPLSDATRSNLVFQGVTISQAGDYSVRVTDRNGALTQSATARLTVLPQAIGRVMPFDLTLVVSNATGNGTTPGDVNGPAAASKFNQPNGGFVAPNGEVYVADTGNHRIKKLTPTGQVLRVAGSGIAGYQDGPADTAQFRDPIGVCVGPDGTVYVAEYGNHRIRTISPAGDVATLAGSGTPAFADGAGAQASFHSPTDLVLAPDGFLYVTDFLNHAIRRVAPSGEVITWAGTGNAGFVNGPRERAQFSSPAGIALLPSGALAIAEWTSPRIRVLSPDGLVSTLAGTGSAGYQDGPAAQAQFREPDGMASDRDGNLFITDRGNGVVRRLSSQGLVQTVSGNGRSEGNLLEVLEANYDLPSGIGVDAQGTVHVIDTGHHRVRSIPLAGVVAAYEQTVLGDAPTAYWRLGNSDNWIATDVATDVMARHPGTYLGGKRFTWLQPIPSTRPDLATAFYTDLNLTVEIPAHRDFVSRQFSVELWARLDPSASDGSGRVHLASASPLRPSTGWMIQADPLGDWEFLLGTGPRWFTLTGPEVRLGEWAHLVGTYDGVRAVFYVNGTAVAARAIGGNLPYLPELTPLRFGHRTTPPRLTGALDEIAVYPHALTPQQVLAHHAAAANPAGLTARVVGGRPTLAWFYGSLLGSPTMEGPWTPVAGARSPHSIDVSQPQQFFRTITP